VQTNSDVKGETSSLVHTLERFTQTQKEKGN